MPNFFGDLATFSLLISMSASDCLAKLKWLPHQGGNQTRNRYLYRYLRLRIKEIEEEARLIRLIIEDTVFAWPHAEAVIHMHDANGCTILRGEIKIVPEVNWVGLLFLVAFSTCILILVILNPAYLCLLVPFMLSSAAVYIFGTLTFKMMVLDTIHRNLDAEDFGHGDLSDGNSNLD